MTPAELDTILAECDKLTTHEYGKPLAALLMDDFHRTIKLDGLWNHMSLAEARLGRMTGVSLKQAFAAPIDIDPLMDSQTGARYGWRGSTQMFEEQLHKNTPEVKTALFLAEVVGEAPKSFVYEGSWFRALAYALRPHLCGHNRWVIAGAGLEGLKEVFHEGLKEKLAPMIDSLQQHCETIGLTLPAMTATFLAAFILYVGTEAFCKYAQDNGKLISLALSGHDPF